ncbi:alanine racemase [Kurthia huakuii]|uniref:alanine racemase n=1 Tax=Kurthia huakuii TaxID=1421019 RepID=UPI000495ADB6|nr:alanine racemase [Kurthia huakuii]MBM7700803.1 alanine racemase [Kurthia huakuii]
MEELQNFRPTKAVIDLKAIQSNISNLRKHLHSDVHIMAVIKANAYGHGDIRVAEAALEAGATMLAVATPEEALHVRCHIADTPILILGAVPVSFAPYAAKYGITLTVFSTEWLEQLAPLAPQFEKPLRIHVKVDSGMGRIGVRTVEELRAVYDAAQMEHVVVDGIFTHFATADDEETTFYEQQLATFKKLVASLPTKPRLVHAANTAAALVKEHVQFDAVRFGISLYGLAPSPYVGEHLPYALQPAFSLETELVHVKELHNGETVGYGATYEATGDEWIGTIPVGYADGVLRGLANQEVLVQGMRAPIVGRICMDQIMIKLPKKMTVGERVVLIGKQGNDEITMQEWASRLNTIVYEIPCMLTTRIPRVYNA